MLGLLASAATNYLGSQGGGGESEAGGSASSSASDASVQNISIGGLDVPQYPAGGGLMGGTSGVLIAGALVLVIGAVALKAAR